MILNNGSQISFCTIWGWSDPGRVHAHLQTWTQARRADSQGDSHNPQDRHQEQPGGAHTPQSWMGTDAHTAGGSTISGPWEGGSQPVAWAPGPYLGFSLPLRSSGRARPGQGCHCRHACAHPVTKAVHGPCAPMGQSGRTRSRSERAGQQSSEGRGGGGGAGKEGGGREGAGHH